MRVLGQIKNVFLYPFAYCVIATQSQFSRIKALGKKPIIHFEQTYAKEKILLIALYEKGRLRPDILQMLKTAKNAGLYVVAINTEKVLQPEILQDQIDCYIERPNFGWDFGSYQTGFLHLFKRGWARRCPRVLMLNDSIFYCKTNLINFFRDLIETNIEVLGATENYDHIHHLQSFCISIDHRIINQQAFQNYWTNYKNTNIKRTVIRNGELKFSRILKSCTHTPENFSALFTYKNIINKLKESKCIDLYTCPLTNLTSNSESSAHSYVLSQQTNKFDIGQLKFLEQFSCNPSIHKNNVQLTQLGLPIIKIDHFYRGQWSLWELDKIYHSLPLNEEEITQLNDMILRRPYGRISLSGWELCAFNLGLI